MLQNIPKEKVLAVVKQGPTFPAKVAKQLVVGGDTVLIGAILSTLVSTGEVKVSSLKIGGTPLYYVPEHESKLEEYIDHLNDKDRKVFKLLKEEKVLQDSEQDPLTRVSLRTIKDFAKPFEVPYQGQKMLFWRFYSLSLNEAESLAKSMVKKTLVEQPRPETKVEPKSVVIERPVVEAHVEVQAILEDKKQEKPVVQDKPTIHEQKHISATHEHHEKMKSHKPKTPKVPKVPKEPKPKVPKVEYNFFEIILNHVAAKNLDIISKEKIKKSEYDLILKNHDTNEYIYCKAKDKPLINEGDLAPAMIFAQSKRMPCLFITTGELTKKAELMLGKELSALKFERILVSNNG